MRLVLVEWVDASRGHEWEPLDNLKEDDLRCKSVGWLASETDDEKVIIPHIDFASTQGCGRMTIPTRAILQIRDLVSEATSPA